MCECNQQKQQAKLHTQVSYLSYILDIGHFFKKSYYVYEVFSGVVLV